MRARRASEASEIRRLQKQRQYLKAKCRRLHKALRELRAEKVGGRIESIWFLRVAFADPKLSMQSLESFCQNFPVYTGDQIDKYILYWPCQRYIL